MRRGQHHAGFARNALPRRIEAFGSGQTPGRARERVEVRSMRRGRGGCRARRASRVREGMLDSVVLIRSCEHTVDGKVV
jgi:hypothetical protein